MILKNGGLTSSVYNHNIVKTKKLKKNGNFNTNLIFEKIDFVILMEFDSK